jgi:uncharacterized coiled-coil DUF342 family protein
MKKCKNCGVEFENLNNRGSEKLYCSKTCRNKSANKRFQENLIKKINVRNDERNEFTTGGNIGNLQGNFTRNEESNGNNYKGIEIDKSSIFDTNDFNFVSQLEKTYNAKNEVLFYKLKCEALEKEVLELKDEISNLEMELDELNQEESGMGGNVIGGLVNSFKSDPQATLSFATEMISNFMKPKIQKNG